MHFRNFECVWEIFVISEILDPFQESGIFSVFWKYLVFNTSWRILKSFGAFQKFSMYFRKFWGIARNLGIFQVHPRPYYGFLDCWLLSTLSIFHKISSEISEYFFLFYFSLFVVFIRNIIFLKIHNVILSVWFQTFYWSHWILRNMFLKITQFDHFCPPHLRTNSRQLFFEVSNSLLVVIVFSFEY